MTFVYANGGEMFSRDGSRCVLDEPPAVEALEFLVDLIYRHKVVPPPHVHAEKRLSFVNGNYAMQITTVQSQSWWNCTLQGRRLDWDLMYAPKSPRTGKRVVQANEQPYVVTKYARQRGVLGEAIAVAIFHVSELVQGMIADVGGATPAHKKILDSDRFLPPPINRKLLLESNAWRRGMDPHRGWRPWWDAVQLPLNRALASEISVKEAASTMAQEGTRALQNPC